MSQEVLHVPLIFSGPGIPAKRVSEQVRNLDIAPTILALAGVTKIPDEMAGADLFGTRRPSLALSEDIAYGPNARSIQDGSHKLVIYDRTKTGRTRFLFKKGTGGKRETLTDDTAVETRLARALELSSGQNTEGRKVELDEETLRALRALGYVD